MAGPPAIAAEPGAGSPAFFDAVVSISPGIGREVDVLLDHVAADGRLTQLSVRLQYPVLPWLQVALEAPALLREPADGAPTAGAGDLLLSAQAAAWAPRDWPAEVDLGLELTLPTGADRVLAGSTAVRPFVAAGVAFGPIDVLANASYQWLAAGPGAGTDLLQTTAAVGYRTRWMVPFVEVTLLKPVRGVRDLRPQVALVPGIEVLLPWNLSLSVGVQLPLGPQRLFDRRVLGFLKWPF
ncbi:MAG TPA: hypothetical protein VFT95_11875 [Micromonosporaceae bacterium]|nr:hypothetical protein [Micromonosporaceae bacterium]